LTTRKTGLPSRYALKLTPKNRKSEWANSMIRRSNLSLARTHNHLVTKAIAFVMLERNNEG